MSNVCSLFNINVNLDLNENQFFFIVNFLHQIIEGVHSAADCLHSNRTG